MSTPAFDPTHVTGYGTTGQVTAMKMNEAATSHSLGLTYNTDSKRFTVLGSSYLSKEALEKIFAKKNYDGWQPQVLDETDSFGNRVVRLADVISSTEEPYRTAANTLGLTPMEKEDIATESEILNRNAELIKRIKHRLQEQQE